MTTPLDTPLIVLPAVAAVRTRIREHAVECDQQNRFPEEALAALRASGLLGLLAPKAAGGLEGSWQDMAAVTHLLARDDLSVALIFAMHCQQTGTITQHASGIWRDELLARIASGNCLIASVTTDPQTGSDPLRPASALARTDGLLRLDRAAPVVTAGLHADAFLITMRDSAIEAQDPTTLVYADRSQLKVEQFGPWEAMGMRATQSIPLHLTGDIPDHQVIGDPGRFRDVAIQTFVPLAHIGWAAAWLGAAAGALSRTVTHLRKEGRKHKRPPTDLSLLRLADARSHIDTVHSALQHVLQLLNTRPATPPSVQLALNNLKTLAAELTLSAVDNLIELIGMRHGYLASSPLGLERIHRDLRSATLTVSNDKVKLASGRLTLLDAGVTLA